MKYSIFIIRTGIYLYNHVMCIFFLCVPMCSKLTPDVSQRNFGNFQFKDFRGATFSNTKHKSKKINN